MVEKLIEGGVARFEQFKVDGIKGGLKVVVLVFLCCFFFFFVFFLE